MKKSILSITIFIVIFLMVGCNSSKPSTENLIKAIEKNDLAKIQNIITQIDANEKSEDEITPIIFAVQKGNIEIVKTLIEAGVKSDITDEEQNTLLHIAVINQNEEIVNLFLDKIDLEAQNAEEKTSLFLAVEKGNAKIVGDLIEAGAKYDIIDEVKNTLLHIAVINHNEDAVKLLLDKIDLEVKNAEEKTPLDIAVEKEYYSLIVKIYFNNDDIENVIKYGDLAIKKDDKDVDSKYFLSESLLKKADDFKKTGRLKDTISTIEKANIYCDEVLAARPENETANNLLKRISETLNSIKKCDSCDGNESIKCVACSGSGSVTKTRTAYRTAFRTTSRISYRTESRISFRMQYNFITNSYTSIPYTEYYQVPYTEYYQESYQQPYQETYTESCPTTQTCSTCKGEGWITK